MATSKAVTQVGMFLGTAVVAFTLAACAADPAADPRDGDGAAEGALPAIDDAVEPQATCYGCDGTTTAEPTPRCAEVCTSTAACGQACIGSNAVPTTCGAYGRCQSCASTCTATSSCSTKCMNGSTLSTCYGSGSACQKYDIRCGYPVITDAAITDNNESGAGGAVAYMYFASAGSAKKSGTFASSLGGTRYDPMSAWASNFRGPMMVSGESDRPQWEWYDSAPNGLSVSWGSAGTPYLYGKQCVAVPAGSPLPRLGKKTETVYEHDECWAGICNPDDNVGTFTIDRGACDVDIFDRGLSRGWSNVRSAAVTSDISRVSYKLWCYSCKNSPTMACSEAY